MKIHPFTAIVFSLLLFFMVLSFEHPLYILSILIFLMVFSWIFDRKTFWTKILRCSLYNALLILFINPLFSTSGKTVLYKSPYIPLLGKIKITAEALAFGATMGLKLICIVFIFFLYGILTDRDDTFVFFSKYAHKMTLMLSMTNNIFHRLLLDMRRVKEVMVLRGVRFEQKNLWKRIQAYYPLLNVILISALEGSIDRAEALYSKQYGTQKRTFYASLQMNKIDRLLNGIHLFLFILFVFSLFKGYGDYQFYPSLQAFQKKDLFFLMAVHVPLWMHFATIWGCNNWNSLRAKT